MEGKFLGKVIISIRILFSADYANSDIIKEKQIGTTRPLMPCELHEM